MDLNRFKQDVGQRLAEGWRSVSERAANALTYFTPAKTTEVSDVRWGLLAVDVSELADTVVVALEAPGLDKDDIDLDVDRQRLLVAGHKHYESQRKEGSVVISERAFGHFQRAIPLPVPVIVEGARATYKKGVLTVTLPKQDGPERRKIKIVAG